MGQWLWILYHIWPSIKCFTLMRCKITADGNCSHEIKRCLLFGRKVMTNVDSILKTRDITLLTKPVYSKLCFLPVVMYGCESWTKKKTENQRTDAFELWWWRRLLRVSGTARSNQSILKEVNLEYSLEPLMLKLKLQYFGHLMWRVNSLKTKEFIWISSNEMDETGAHYTEWSKPER